MVSPLTSLGLDPGSRWHKLLHLCEKKFEVKDGEELTGGWGGNNEWGEWICSVGTLSIGALTPCTPCQKIEYTCRDTGDQVYKETFCPVGAKYPDRRLDLIGHYLPAEGSEDDEITVPKKSCPQIQRETVRFVSTLWKKDCDIKTNGELDDLLTEAGPHCGSVRYSCPDAEGHAQPQEWQYCAKRIGTWEMSMRQFLLTLSPECTVEGSGKTALWWKYYQDILMNTNPEAVYGFDVTSDKEADELVTDETLLYEYLVLKKGRKIYRKLTDLMSVALPVFFRDQTLPAWSKSWSQQTVGDALSAACSPVTVQGGYEDYMDDAEESWFKAAEDRALDTLICPAPELGRYRRR